MLLIAVAAVALLRPAGADAGVHEHPRVAPSRVAAVLDAHPPQPLPELVRDAVRRSYLSSGGHLRFLSRGQLSPAGQRLVQALDRVQDHALPAERYFQNRVRTLAAKADEPAELAELDILLVRAFVLLGADLRPAFAGTAEERVAELATARKSAEAMEQTLASWLPRWPHYGRLVAAHRRYRLLVERGESVAVPTGGRLPRPGARHSVVPALRARLTLEGYYPPAETQGEPVAPAAADELYDGPLREAVGHYQYARLQEATGTLDRESREALAVPLAERLSQIALALVRWRESPVRGLDAVLRVNIPQCLAELYVDGAIVETYRVVVGRPESVRSGERGLRAPLNQTPSVASAIDRIVLNPVWRVPHRIARDEIEPLQRKDPGYFDRNGFLARGETLVQLPGPRNALGQVKFLFENEAGIYLHDTPQRRLFRRPRRAFSHGCVRVEHPMRLARFLLARESHTSAGREDALLAGGHETELHLARPLPIVIEYNTVGVDEQGRAVFYPDLYGRDRARLARPIEGASPRGPRSAP